MQLTGSASGSVPKMPQQSQPRVAQPAGAGAVSTHQLGTNNMGSTWPLCAGTCDANLVCVMKVTGPGCCFYDEDGEAADKVQHYLTDGREASILVQDDAGSPKQQAGVLSYGQHMHDKDGMKQQLACWT